MSESATPPRLETVAEILAEAWREYVGLFGEPPHGTVRQLEAMLELRSAYKRIAQRSEIAPKEQVAWCDGFLSAADMLEQDGPEHVWAKAAQLRNEPAESASRVAHSKSEYKRITAQGGDVLPPAARCVAVPQGMALVCAVCRYPVDDANVKACTSGEACPHKWGQRDGERDSPSK